MAPCLKSVYNVSGKSVHVNIDDRSFDIDHDQSQPINISITTDAYTEIDRVNSEDILGYRLKYQNYKIVINDALGKSKGIADQPIYTKSYDQDIRIRIFEKEMYISCNGNYFGIKRGRRIIYYRSVDVRHISGGGVTVHGGEKTVEGDEAVKGEEDEGEEASASTD